MPKKGVLRGPKLNRRHSTYNKVAEQVILILKEMPTVTKIVLGPIRQLKGGQPRITVREDKTQARIQCRDIGSVQVLWAIGADPTSIRDFLRNHSQLEVVE